MNVETFLRPDIVDMEAYSPVVPFEVLSERLNRAPDEMVKLDANENPYGPSPLALAALASRHFFHIYPDPDSNALREALSAHTGLPPKHLLTGAGADELIDLVARAIISPGDVIINCPPTFGMYPFVASVNGARLVQVSRQSDFRLNIATIERAVAETSAKLLFLCSPNNPDGSLIGNDELRHLLELPVLLVLDEAYIEFVQDTKGRGQSRICWVPEHDNLVVLRTFSKWAGLAGLRVGYGAFPEWLIAHLWKIKQPYNVNVAATQAALASLADVDWLADKVARLIAERDRLIAVLDRFSFLSPYPSSANFVLCQVNGIEAVALRAALEQGGILVRHFAKPGLENCIRISAGRPEDTDRLLRALRDVEERL